jgi:16S rRNA (cytosine967-C5)-methyltransferase
VDKNRKTAFYTLMDVELKKSYSNIVLNHHIVRCKPDSTAFVTELVYGVIENKMLLDYMIDLLVATGSAKMRMSDRTVLRMGIYQIGYMNSVPEYAAVNESVNLAKRFCKGREGFINASLRSYIKEMNNIKLPDRSEDEVRYLSVKYSYEPWIIELWRGQYDTDFVEELLIAGNATPGLVIRVNWLKTAREDLIKRLETMGCVVEKGKLYEDALHVKNGGVLIGSRLFKNGLFSIQDEGSMLAVAMLDPKHGDLVMDICAAPGGKTMAIAERMNNNGRIIASDIYIRKLGLINNEAKRLGVKIVETRTWDASKIDKEMVEKADRVIVDAPCTGLGVIRRKPEIKYKKRTAETDMLPAQQLQMLLASSQYVKQGGVLVYSTCTINLRENNDVIAEFLNKRNHFIKEEEVQLMPNVNGTDGFFICKMRKSLV